jgi:hypothetical protein
MSDSITFQRVIVGIRHHAPHQGLRQAVDIATLLGIELRGLFVKDDEFDRLAAFPFIREFRTLEGGWRDIHHSEMASAADVAARNAERSFQEAVKILKQPCEFEVIQGRTTAEAIASLSRSGDILIVNEPSHPAEQVTWKFQSMVKAALGSPASILWIPTGDIREEGPIVAVATAPGDPCIEIAAQIAARMNERLSIVAPHMAAGELDELWGPRQERLIVLSRGVFDSSISRISSIRRVPVLLVEPRQ